MCYFDSSYFDPTYFFVCTTTVGGRGGRARMVIPTQPAQRTDDEDDLFVVRII